VNFLEFTGIYLNLLKFAVFEKRVTDGWTDGGTDGRTDRRTDGRKDGRTDGRTDGHLKWLNESNLQLWPI